MNKETFLHQLRIRLSQLPESEIQKRLDYYEELIEDMKDDGITEEDAVAGFGDVNEIAMKIMQETPLAALMKSKVKPKNGWTTATIIMAVIGSPIWVPLLFAFMAVIASVFVVIWTTILCLFIGVLCLGISGIYLLVKAFTLIGFGLPTVFFTLGCSIGLIGLCLLAFLAAKVIARFLVRLTGWTFRQIKSLFIRKEAA